MVCKKIADIIYAFNTIAALQLTHSNSLITSRIEYVFASDIIITVLVWHFTFTKKV